MAGITTVQRGKYGIEFRGIAELTRELSRDGELWKRVQQAAVDGMTENTEDLLGRSMRDAPVDEGTLRASGTAEVYVNGRAVARRGFRKVAKEPGSPVMVTRPVREGGLGDAVVGEVGFNTPYALTQHERLDFHHPKGGKAKYLQSNLETQAEHYQENLADRLREALR
ncbi:MAG: hypothetical protein ACE149_16560 [Armatimonadota bacterium]